MRRAAAGAIGLAGALAAACPGSVSPALADADPASDVLVLQDVFLPYAQPQKARADALRAVVERVYQSGNRIKVAVIGAPSDLGGVLGLWNQPGHYATFLGREIAFLYVGPLLVVMPVGFGIYDGGRSVVRERAVLTTLPPPGPGSDALTAAATAVLERLSRVRALRSKDVLPPRATTYAASVRRGATANLYYTVADDSDRAAAALWVSARGKRVLATRLPLRRLHRHQGSLSLTWRVPHRVPTGTGRFCISARDAAGNASSAACATISIR